VDVTPKSLILDLLSTLPARGGHSMPVRALVEAGSDFGMANSSVRVALARLLAQERVESDARGRYRLGVAADAVSHAVRNWRKLDEQVVDWRGGWIAVHRRQPGARSRRRDSNRSLVFLGFREFEPGLFLRPDNLRGDISELRARLKDLGLEASALVFALADLDSGAETKARGLWDELGLVGACQAATQALIRSRARLDGASARDAMVETFCQGGRVIRQLVLDPLLPDSISPAAPREALAAQMLDYDAFGRSCWAPFLEKHGVSHRRTPADLRLGDGTDHLASAALLRSGDSSEFAQGQEL